MLRYILRRNLLALAKEVSAVLTSMTLDGVRWLWIVKQVRVEVFSVFYLHLTLLLQCEIRVESRRFPNIIYK